MTYLDLKEAAAMLGVDIAEAILLCSSAGGPIPSIQTRIGGGGMVVRREDVLAYLRGSLPVSPKREVQR